jgi:hypothetical protein
MPQQDSTLGRTYDFNEICPGCGIGYNVWTEMHLYSIKFRAVCTKCFSEKPGCIPFDQYDRYFNRLEERRIKNEQTM